MFISYISTMVESYLKVMEPNQVCTEIGFCGEMNKLMFNQLKMNHEAITAYKTKKLSNYTQSLFKNLLIMLGCENPAKCNLRDKDAAKIIATIQNMVEKGMYNVLNGSTVNDRAKQMKETLNSN
ncbi:hypothetical protein A3Q56_06563 [Intoshia linei]|uniref:Uncharacterized protein n=1 Tax=Intoshia linei TaxID=1819745 RepID=A0A177AUR9_9BILA|nr:hypothetical protein A3Q56_06563 [Intoshia linei]